MALRGYPLRSLPKGAEGLGTTRFARVLVAAALAVGLAFVSPAAAQGPQMMMSDAWAKNHAREQLKFYGWTHSAQWQCLASLWGKESGWRLKAFNPIPVRVYQNGKWIKKHAGGIPQILGLSPSTPAPTQIRKGLVYIESRYGSPCQAWKFWQSKNWY